MHSDNPLHLSNAVSVLQSHMKYLTDEFRKLTKKETEFIPNKFMEKYNKKKSNIAVSLSEDLITLNSSVENIIPYFNSDPKDGGNVKIEKDKNEKISIIAPPDSRLTEYSKIMSTDVVYIDSNYDGTESNGTLLYPYSNFDNISNVISAAKNPLKFIVRGSFNNAIGIFNNSRFEMNFIGEDKNCELNNSITLSGKSKIYLSKCKIISNSMSLIINNKNTEIKDCEIIGDVNISNENIRLINCNITGDNGININGSNTIVEDCKLTTKITGININGKNALIKKCSIISDGNGIVINEKEALINDCLIVSDEDSSIHISGSAEVENCRLIGSITTIGKSTILNCTIKGDDGIIISGDSTVINCNINNGIIINENAVGSINGCYISVNGINIKGFGSISNSIINSDIDGIVTSGKSNINNCTINGTESGIVIAGESTVTNCAISGVNVSEFGTGDISNNRITGKSVFGNIQFLFNIFDKNTSLNGIKGNYNTNLQ